MRNRFYLWILFISGVLLFAFIVVTGYREVNPEWKVFQTQYKSELVKAAHDEVTKSRAANLPVEVKQTFLGNLKRVDRCVSCHVGMENPMMAKANIPIKAHSGDILKNHPVDKFGCTICHSGQGRALNKEEAHAVAHEAHWGYPLIPLQYVQSSCVHCHDFEMLRKNGGEKVVQGELLFQQKGCKGCHKLEGVGGVLGKTLDGVGSQPTAYFPMSKVRGEHNIFSWLKEHFEDPRNIVPTSEMKIDVSDRESDLLTTYVLSLRSEEMPRWYRRTKTTESVVSYVRSNQSGEALYKMYCVACHTTGKDSIFDEIFKRTIPAIKNPSFVRAAGPDYLKMVIKEGRSGTPMTAWKMSAAGLTDQEIGRLIEYVRKEALREHGVEPFKFTEYKGDGERGRELFKIRCASCHGTRGEGGVGLNLRNPVVQNSADPEFLAITIRDGRRGTHMASFGKKGVGLSNQDIADLVTFVKSLTTKNVK
jgi:mono/diheme cytochrome c family protein